MKKLLYASALALMVAAFAVPAGAAWSGNDAIDSNGVAVVSIDNSLSGPTVMPATHDSVRLDSNGLFTAYGFERTSGEALVLNLRPIGKGMNYCFDSGSKFCTRAY